MTASIRETVLDLLSAHADPPADPEAPLELESLSLVLLGEEMEERFGLRVAARDVVPANFGSVAAMTAFVASKLGKGGP